MSTATQPKLPSDFTIAPWNSVLQKSEAETIAANIMVILKRTGNQWRTLTWDEYKEERLKDAKTDRSHFTEGEKFYFDLCIPYCLTAETAALFAPDWKKIANGEPIDC